MEEIEVPTEHLHEAMEHHAEHASAKERWLTGVALSSAIIAALAAVAALFAGGDSNQAILLQMKASNQWNYYQAKGVKLNVLASKLDMLERAGQGSGCKGSRQGGAIQGRSGENPGIGGGAADAFERASGEP